MQDAGFMPTIMSMALGHSILAWGMLYSIWYANLWGSWGMQSARIMPTFQINRIIPNSWHGECREQLLCQDLLWIGKPPYIGMALATEVFPILAWYVLPAIAVPEKKFY